VDKLETIRGTVFENEKAFLFFGTKLGLLDSIKNEYPNFHFYKIKQVHGEVCVETSKTTKEEVTADAHWTQEKNTALCIYTADCIPCLVYCNKTNRVAGIHAGWRGVANQIIPKTLRQLMDSGSSPSSFQVFCGPHIGGASFEVDQPVRNQILQTLSPIHREKCVTDISPQKSLIHLAKVVEFQLGAIGIQNLQIEWLEVDTRTNDKYHSFRRDKTNSGRNLSFIVLK
jgi:YfiH family protein